MVSAPSCNKVHIQIQSELPLSLTSFLFSSGRGTSARTRFLSPYAFPRRRPRARRRVRRSLPPPRGACRADRKGVPPRGAASRRAGGERLPPIRPAHHRRGARMVRNALLRPCFHLCVRHVELEEARSEAQPSVIWGRKKACPQQCRTGRDAKRSACTPLGLDDHVKKKVGWNHQKRRTKMPPPPLPPPSFCMGPAPCTIPGESPRKVFETVHDWSKCVIPQAEHTSDAQKYDSNERTPFRFIQPTCRPCQCLPEFTERRNRT